MCHYYDMAFKMFDLPDSFKILKGCFAFKILFYEVLVIVFKILYFYIAYKMLFYGV